ncbi:CHAP domain-containing protein [Candidatus Roizmanbacteria bacterium]|nr:CHAP domain-containing protein [Candidatus Roizmanbacteria bacterium]
MSPVLVISMLNGNIRKYAIAAALTVTFVLMMPLLAILSLGEDAMSFLAGSASAQSAEEQGFYMGAAVPGDTYAWGNCTYWTFAMRLWADKPIPTTWGNANTWDENAVLDGYVVDHVPAVATIMQTDDGDLGHVAFVTTINAETGQWTISEMNAPRFNVVSTRTFDKSSAIYYDFIHDKMEPTP